MKTTYALLLFAILSFSTSLFAQVPEDDTTELVRVELMSGEEIFGSLQSQTNEKITVELSSGEIRIIPFKLVRKLERVNAINKFKKKNFYNVQSSRYFISGNAIGIRKGEGYYRNGWVFFNEATYGVTDFFSVSGGLIPVIFFGETNVPYWVSPKVNIPIKEDLLYVGGGVLLGGITGMTEVSGLSGLGYGNITFGNRNANATIMGGFAFSEGESERVPAIGVSGMLRISPKFYLITENYIVEDLGFFSIGGRTIWSGISLDYGLFAPMEAEILFPWLGIMVPFN